MPLPPAYVFFAASRAQAEDALIVSQQLAAPVWIVPLWPDVLHYVSTRPLATHVSLASLATNLPPRFQKLALSVRGRWLISRLAAQRPVVVFGDDMNQYQTATIQAAQRLGLPSVLMQDGLLDPYDLDRVVEGPRRVTRYGLAVLRSLKLLPVFNNRYGMGGCDHVAVYGSSTVDLLSQWGADPARLHLTGAPRFDPLFKLAASPFSAARPVVLCLGLLLAERYWGTAEQDRQWLGVLEAAARQFPGRRFILRPHPSESLDRYRERLHEIGATAVEVRRDDDLYELLLSSESVVTHYLTTVLFEAIILGRPVVFLESPAAYQRNSFMDDRVVTRLTDWGKLPGTLAGLSETNPAESREADRQAYIGRHFGFQDGASGQRVAALLSQVRAHALAH